jgi:hypothetical protein
LANGGGEGKKTPAGSFDGSFGTDFCVASHLLLLNLLHDLEGFKNAPTSQGFL